jgi:predicted N-formylglutamate amidohydrolase
MRSPSKSSAEQQSPHGMAEPMWLDPDEPAAFELCNAEGSNALVLIADHASSRVPRCLGQLGLSDEVLSSHIAWDAGTAKVARHLSELLDAPLLLSNYSRLVIDCNRAASSEEAILEASDGIQIPGNRKLGAEHIASRVRTLFAPYHDAIEALLDARKDRPTTILSIHSFSPELQGEKRPWSIGVCYGDDPRLAHGLLPELHKLAPSPVGDNEPYSIEDGIDYSLPRHASTRGLPHVMLEIRRDLIGSDQGARHFAELIQTAWLAL